MEAIIALIVLLLAQLTPRVDGFGPVVLITASVDGADVSICGERVPESDAAWYDVYATYGELLAFEPLGDGTAAGVRYCRWG